MSETTNDTQACTQVTSVQEVRPGLFRMHWIFDHSRMKEGCHKKDFYLSLPDQFYTITYHLKYSDIKLKPYRYSVTVEASSTHGEYSDEEQTSFETNSSIHSQPSQSQSNDLLELDITFCPKWQEFHAPVYMWINTDRSSTHGNKVPLLKKISGQWQCRRWCRKLRDRLTVWVDFGTGSVIEKNNLNVMNNVAEMFHSQTQCDVVFQFQDGQTIGAHVLILSAGSPVFASMFQGSTDRKVEIVDFEMAIFTQLLTYLYTGVAPRMSEENITPILLEAANKYGVEMLKIECTDVLLTRMTIENNVHTLIWSQKHSASKLFEAALEFLVDNFNTICYRSEWKDLIKNDPDLCMLVTQRVADDRYSLTK